MKGIEVAVQALEIVRRSHPFVRLKIAGASSASSAHGRLLMRRLRAANLMGSVDFLGFLSSKQLAQEMLNAHIFVSASHIENSPNSLAEAMLLGMPCIATFTGGVPSMMRDGVEGLLFPRGDAVTLAALIKTLIDDDVTAERFGCQARERALRDHDPETVVNQLVQSYREAMELSSDGRRI
jgi:glycosyltransferase involved in cell wall biosynthesis